MPEPGDVIVTKVQFVDGAGIKTRPALVLFEEHGNIVAAGITSNPNMEGIPILKNEGAIKDSVIKLNYLFTTSGNLIFKTVFKLSKEKRRLVFEELSKRLSVLKNG